MEIEVYRSFDFSGRPNEYAGLVFSILPRGKHWVFDFLIRELQEGKSPVLKITMEPDINHVKPHIHLSRLHNHHFASIGLDGHFIHGEEQLDRDEKRAISDWLNGHGITLRELWDCAKEGRPDYQKHIERVNNTWEYEGFVFNGPQPSNHIIMNDITVWYDGELSQSQKGDYSTLYSTGRMCVIVPVNEKNWRFFSGAEAPQIYIRGTLKN